MSKDPLEAAFRAFGFVVLRQVFDGVALRAELLRSLSPTAPSLETGVANVQYVPMMCEHTPLSLALLERSMPLAERLLGGAVIPTRAKGMRYFGDTSWHSDSERDLDSLGVLAYLDPLGPDQGALRVVPGSHQRNVRAELMCTLDSESNGLCFEPPEYTITTQVGDLIILDEHLYHASFGGTERLQWRIDYLRDPRTSLEEAAVRRWFAEIFDPRWAGGYDTERYPNYGEAFLRSGLPVVERLRELGVLDLAAGRPLEP